MLETNATSKDNKQEFLGEYQHFLENYKQGGVNGEQVGEIIARMANYFAISNTKYGDALIAYNAVASSIEQTTDEKGKVISSAKSKILAGATPESGVYIKAKCDIESISEVINALKSLQKGLLYEQNCARIS